MTLSKKPIAAWMFDEEGPGPALEYFNDPDLSISLVNDPILGINGLDFSQETDDYADIDAADNTALRTQPPFSIAIGIHTGGTVSRQQFYWCNAGASAYAGYGLITNSSGIVEFIYGDNTGTLTGNRRSFTGPVLSTNTDYIITVTCNDTSGVASGVTINVDEVDQTVAFSGTGGAMAFAENPAWLGRRRNATQYDSSHTCRFLFIYDHILADFEIAAINDDYLTAVDGVEIPVPVTPIDMAVDSSIDLGGMLSYPRWKITLDPDNIDTVILIVGDSPGIQNTWVSEDRGNSWASLGTTSWDDHQNLNRGSDGVLHVGGRVYEGGNDGLATYSRYTSAWQTAIEFDDYTGEGGTAHVIPHDGDVFAIVRSNFGYSPYTIFWHRSTDNGVTFGTANTLVQPESNINHRIGAIYTDGIPTAIVWDQDATFCTIKLYRWSGSAFVEIANNDFQTTSDSITTRNFCVCEADNGTIHCVWWDELTGPTYVLRHSFRTLAGTWSTPVTITETYNSTQSAVTLTTHNNIPYLIYTFDDGGEAAIGYRLFNGSWSGVTKLSAAGGDCGNANTSMVIPADFNYIPVGYVQTVGETLKYVAIPVTPFAGGSIGLLLTSLNDAVSSFSGKKGNSSLLTSNTDSAILSNSGKEGKVGQILILSFDATVRLLGLESQVIFTGVLNSNLSDNLLSSLGKKGNTAVIDSPLDNVLMILKAIKGNRGDIDFQTFTGVDIAGKIGVKGNINIVLESNDIKLIEVTISDRIYQILISTVTGEISILGPKTGTINIGVEP